MIVTRTPYRISFVGGGTDFRDFYKDVPGLVVSTAIDKYMYITVKHRFEDDFRVSYHKTEIKNKVRDIEHPIVRECLKLVGIKKGLEITSIGDVPAGTGLGSSSSFTVGLLNALFALQGIRKSAEDLASLASKVEIDILKEPIGKQDQYISAYGGIKKIQFNPDEGVAVKNIILKDGVLRDFKGNLLMFYTGHKRSASSILHQQKNNCRRNKESLKALKEMAVRFYDCLMQGNDLCLLGRILHEGWLIKKGLASDISNSYIDGIYKDGLRAGAIGGKVLGAGGGGFILFYCPKKRQKDLRNSLKRLREFKFNFEPNGSKVVYTGGV